LIANRPRRLDQHIRIKNVIKSEKKLRCHYHFCPQYLTWFWRRKTIIARFRKIYYEEIWNFEMQNVAENHWIWFTGFVERFPFWKICLVFENAKITIIFSTDRAFDFWPTYCIKTAPQQSNIQHSNCYMPIHVRETTHDTQSINKSISIQGGPKK